MSGDARYSTPIRAATVAAALWLPLAAGAEPPQPAAAAEVLASVAADAHEYAPGGMEACTKCHDQTDEYPVLAVLATPHGVTADGRTPMGGPNACQACHGPSAAHVQEPAAGQPRAAVGVRFGPEHPVEPQNQVCLGCHQGGDRMLWRGSTHDQFDLACTSCHQVHVQEDPVLVKNIDPLRFSRDGQARVCFTCHLEQRAQIQQRVSGHPLREGKMECSGCHNTHGSLGPHLLARPTLNQTCYQCHAEKRGPFLWEHAPVREDCGICHTPHGSNHPALLKTRQPFLCQQCHLASRHPSTAYFGPDFVTPEINLHVFDSGCLNCHSEVHGSNHPSGVRQVR